MNKTTNIKSIANGAELFCINTNRFKTSKISVNFALPLKADTAAQAILPYILHRSSKDFPNFTLLNRRLAELYGAVLSARVTKIGEVQVLNLGITSIDDRFSLDGDSVIAECAQLLCDLIFKPNIAESAFLQEDVEREKRLLLEMVESEKNDKRAFALRRCEEIMCATEAYSIDRFGDVEDIKALDGSKIYHAWQNMLQTAKIQINVISSADACSVENVFKNRFSNIDRQNLAQLQTEIIHSVDNVKIIEEEQPINQGKLVLGYRTSIGSGDDANPAIRVMVDLFGGGPYSKLFTNVREKLSLCYYCAARLYKQKGIIMVQSGIENCNKDQAIKEISHQLDMVKKGEFEDSEMDASKRALYDALQGAGDTPEEINEWYMRQITAQQILSPQEFAELIEGVNREDIMQAANGVTLDTVYMLKGTGGEEE